MVITGFEPVTSALSKQRSKPTELNDLETAWKTAGILRFCRSGCKDRKILPFGKSMLPIFSWLINKLPAGAMWFPKRGWFAEVGWSFAKPPFCDFIVYDWIIYPQPVEK